MVRTMSRSWTLLVLLCLAGCAGSSKLLGGEIVRDTGFPAGYRCTNYSEPYVRAAYGIVTGQLKFGAGESVHGLIGPPKRECDPDNAEMKDLARTADANKDRVLTYEETLAALERLRTTEP
jgi:hypothetical protein